MSLNLPFSPWRSTHTLSTVWIRKRRCLGQLPWATIPLATCDVAGHSSCLSESDKQFVPREVCPGAGESRVSRLMSFALTARDRPCLAPPRIAKHFSTHLPAPRDPSTLGDSGWTVHSKSGALRGSFRSGTGACCPSAERLAVWGCL